jgi:mono/diheme cytochrome c family protein
MKTRLIQAVVGGLLVVTALHARADNTEVQNPFQNSEPARAAGQKLYMRHCSECHGTRGEGSNRAPAIVEFARSTSPGMLHSFIKNGNLRAGMPSWSRLPDQRLWQLVTYLQSMKRGL